MKPRVYLESSFISYLASRPSNDLVKQVRQQLSQDFWDLRSDAYLPFCCALVIDEVGRGDSQAAVKRLEIANSLPILEIGLAARDLAQALMATGAVPPTEPEDALHIAVAAVEQMDFIVTWNFAHLVGPVAKLKLQRVLSAMGFDRLLLATPEELLEELNSAR